MSSEKKHPRFTLTTVSDPDRAHPTYRITFGDVDISSLVTNVSIDVSGRTLAKVELTVLPRGIDVDLTSLTLELDRTQWPEDHFEEPLSGTSQSS